jgi:glucokinase
MRLLAGDIGGTKTLLRCTDGEGGTVAEERYDSGAYATFDELLRDFIVRLGEGVSAACFAVAGPVYGARAEITNVGWTIDQDELTRQFPIDRIWLINDFYAVALGVPLLDSRHLVSLHPGTRDPSAPIAILGAGTGLGQAIVTRHGNVHHVLPTEGGHADFAPQDEEQARLFLELHRRYGHVSWERLLSGAGLVNIFTFLGGEELDPAEIARRADAGDARANRAFAVFADIYGAESGNMALRVLARGGVYLAGGIAAKNVERFTDGRFVEAYLRKGRFRDLVSTIPVDLIVNEEVGLIGAAAGARRIVESLPGTTG